MIDKAREGQVVQGDSSGVNAYDALDFFALLSCRMVLTGGT